MAHPAWPHLGEGGETARVWQCDTTGATGHVCSAGLLLLPQLCHLASKCGGSQSLPVHPGTSLPTIQWESEPSPHPELGSGSWCGVGPTSLAANLLLMWQGKEEGIMNSCCRASDEACRA